MAIPRVDWLADLIRNECGVWLAMPHGSLQDVALDTLLCLSRLGSSVFLATWSPSARGFLLRITSVLALRFD